MFLNKLWNKLWSKSKKKRKSKIRLSENQVQQIIEMAKDELEVRRISNVVNIMLNDYDDICLYIEDLHNIIDKLWIETNNLETCLIYENIKRYKSYSKSVS